MAEVHASTTVELRDHVKQSQNIKADVANKEQEAAGTPPDAAVDVETSQKLCKADLTRLIVAGFAFFCSGINDGSLGPLIPYILRQYQINTNFVSIVYGVTFFGWFTAAATNSHLTQILDLGAILTLGAICQLVAHCLRAWLPPFGLFATSFWFAHMGQGYQDMHANSWVAAVKAAHRWLGFIHAMYMLGCLVAPFVATGVASANDVSKWYLFYTFAIGLNVINVAATAWAFRDTLRVKRKSRPQDELEGQGSQTVSRNKDAIQELKATLRIKSVWILAGYFFFFLGVAITAGGWVVTYLVDVRNGKLSDMGYVPSGYYGGAFLGRLLLAEPTYRYGERLMICIYVVICLALQLVFWLVPSIIAGAVTISLLGFFSGPFFATGISVGSKLFPQHVRHSALAIVFVIGQIGGSVFPAITGVIAASAGVRVLQPILVALIVLTGLTWLCLPRVNKHSD
jgi:fucose permease